ncbi:MAG: type II secretion system F family protein [Planctomycetia bacterium]|jgi:tight adherence protein B|nr:type II secretion system F family protein [Planctomycetia bacterium]
MSPVVITLIAVFVGTAALCAAVGFGVVARQEDPFQRLERLNRRIQTSSESTGILKKEFWEEGAAGMAEVWKRIGFGPGDIIAWFRQAELPFRAHWLPVIAGILSLSLMAVAKRLHLASFTLPIAGLTGAFLPLVYVWWRRKRIIYRFSEQLPEALELMANSLRSGNTLQSSMQLISEEFMPPISREFGIVSESINLGIPVEQTLDEMTARVPNVDLQFFVTAVSMQRQCGGDLSEVLDKISWLIRERFMIQGQVQALTGEGRLSGVVLMALPVVLFCALYVLNQDYVMLLFTDATGRKMLYGAIMMQLLGALVIRKIINIKI